MQAGLRHFDSRALGWLAGALRAGGMTRRALARELRERTGRRNACGRPCLSAAAKALPAPDEWIGWTAARIGRAIFPAEAERKAACRLLSSPRAAMDRVPEPRFEATADRCRGERAVLAVQGAAALNCAGLEATTGLDEIGGGGRGSVGILARAGLAATAEGRPLGLFAMDAAFRADGEEDSRRRVRMPGRAGELAAACPGTRVTAVCGREGDFRDLLAHAAGGGGALLARAGRGLKQSVRTADGRECLWERVAGLAPVSSAKRTIPAEGEAAAVRAAAVPDWRRTRWTIETWFGTLKTGTRNKSRRLDEAGDLRKCLAFDATTACRRRRAAGTRSGWSRGGRRRSARRSSTSGARPASIPGKGQKLPGAKRVRQGLERLNRAIRVRDATGAGRREQGRLRKCGSLKGSGRACLPAFMARPAPEPAAAGPAARRISSCA